MLSVFIVVDVPWLLLIVVFYLMIVLDICIFAVLCSDNEHVSWGVSNMVSMLSIMCL